MGARDPVTWPTGLRRVQAARHCGVSASVFDDLVRDGILPPPRVLRGVSIWLRQELDDALFSLERRDGGNSCDEIFAASGSNI